MGEYVFDHGWAEAFERAGGRYYPKLQASVPFTPVTGRRLLAKPGADAGENRGSAGRGRRARSPTSSAPPRCTSPSPGEAERQLLAECRLPAAHRPAVPFRQRGLRDFDDFLDTLASRKRKAIRRERREALADGIEIVRLTGKDLTEKRLGRLLPFLHGYGLAQMGPALSQPPVLLADRRTHGRPHPADLGHAGTASRLPARSISSAPMRSTAAIGAPPPTSPSCISSSATIRRSTGPSPTA